MIPLGYLAKRIPVERPEWLKAPGVVDIYSVSECANDTLVFYDDHPDCPYNRYGMYDSPALIALGAKQYEIDLTDSKLFFYEAYESEFDGDEWVPVASDDASDTEIILPAAKELVGFDVVTQIDGLNSHSPLSCNSIAEEVHTNQHCLFATLDETMSALASGVFDEAEGGPYRVYAVYLLAWPE